MTKKNQKKYIFIDTNLYRGLFIYSKSEKDIFPILKKLASDKYFILMPQQVLDELNRHIFSDWLSNKNQNKIKNLEKVVSELDKDFLSNFSYKEKLINQINREIIKIKKQDEILEKQLIFPKGRSVKLIKKLLNIVKVIPDTEEIFKATQQRIIKGNPPFDKGANGKHCDRYIWESLLFYFRNQEEKAPFLYLFTQNAQDWCDRNRNQEKKDKYQFSQFLLYEFENKTKGKIIWHDCLQNLPDISSIDKKVVRDVEQRIQKEDIIFKIEKSFPEKLFISDSLHNTDKIILEVINYISEFSSSLISEILDASLQNSDYIVDHYNQVLNASWAKRFFAKLYNHSKKIKFPAILWKKFYLQLDKEQQKKFYNIRKDIEKRGVEFDLKKLKFIHPDDIPF